jgi:hypothetical protein
MGESETAPRQVCLEENGSVTVAVPGLGSFQGLAAVGLPAGVVDELEAECRPLETGRDPGEPGSSVRLAAGVDDDVAGASGTEARVKMYLMGGFRVTRDGVDVPMGATSSARARELSARLAVADAPVPMGELLEDLWPDDIDARVTKVQPLFQLVTRARGWLLGNAKDDSSSIIEHQPGSTRAQGSYRLQGVWVDVAVFRAAAGRETRQGLEEALKLYGSDLLSGHESEVHYRWVKAGGYRDTERFRFYAVVAPRRGPLGGGRPRPGLGGARSGA